MGFAAFPYVGEEIKYKIRGALSAGEFVTMQPIPKKLILCTDGGSRGNPGKAALGVVIKDERERVIKEYGEYLGDSLTNNEAEYHAVLFGLKKIKHLFGGEKIKKITIEVRSDSDLLVNQLSGNFKIEGVTIIPLFVKIWNLRIDFGPIEFVHVPREKNQEADRLVNQALDREGARLF